MAGIWASRVSRRYFSIFGCKTVSSFRLRTVVDRSLRRLCIALKRLDDASATTEIRFVVASRCHESQAVKQSRATMQVDIRTMTDWISDDTVRRFNMNRPSKFRL